MLLINKTQSKKCVGYDQKAKYTLLKSFDTNITISNRTQNDQNVKCVTLSLKKIVKYPKKK